MIRVLLALTIFLSGCGQREPVYYGVCFSQWILMTQDQKECAMQNYYAQQQAMLMKKNKCA